MEKKKAMRKKEMIELYKDYNIITPSNQALGRFAKMLGYSRRRVMERGRTTVWYVQAKTVD